MDDILVYSATMDDHITHQTDVFQVLLQYQLLAKAFKYSFAQNNIEYLGHIISDIIRVLLLTPKKTVTMAKQPTPKSHTELRGFHGFTRYHRKFIQYHGIMPKPLTVLLQHKVFSQSDSAYATFDDMKLAMVSAPMLALPNFLTNLRLRHLYVTLVLELYCLKMVILLHILAKHQGWLTLNYQYIKGMLSYSYGYMQVEVLLA